jgi:hypothetical protein
MLSWTARDLIKSLTSKEGERGSPLVASIVILEVLVIGAIVLPFSFSLLPTTLVDGSLTGRRADASCSCTRAGGVLMTPPASGEEEEEDKGRSVVDLPIVYLRYSSFQLFTTVMKVWNEKNRFYFFRCLRLDKMGFGATTTNRRGYVLVPGNFK